VHDAIIMQQQAIPAVVVVTDVFGDLARRCAENLGVPGLEPVVVPHPIYTRDDAWIRAVTEQTLDAVLARLGPWRSSPGPAV
jgi:hypothetical protein